jgi:hypothetical protein
MAVDFAVCRIYFIWSVLQERVGKRKENGGGAFRGSGQEGRCPLQAVDEVTGPLAVVLDQRILQAKSVDMQDVGRTAEKIAASWRVGIEFCQGV